jgi:hypothetical protein
LRLSDAPESWPVGTGVQLFVHAWNSEKSAWNGEPIAFTQGTVTPRRLVNGTLFLLASPNQGSDWDASGASLAPGKYLVKVYVDAKRRLAGDPVLLLGKDEFTGQAEIEARWREGFPQAEMLSATRLQN